ncbi:sialic acid-binding Ig-like lectin 5 isoform X2 [Artibeus jamaicensis]|uniref:sialic acid-binding Ig-like lectin 5 isoform X2 n=1 Tax=Artibeus jamaicensis TaxID=9417 RepID=UPI00235B1783|nr:sialic acid-binding Ig-like lectin 5 isoform X2 [Artibeus jamaicensis]
MVPLLLLSLLWGGSLQEEEGYELGVQHLVKVQEGLCVHVPCSFSYPWRSWYSSGELYTYLYWRGEKTRNFNLVATNNPNKAVKRETKDRFLLGDPRTNNCSLSVRDARKSDAGTYVFQVERGNVPTYKDKRLNLQVTDLTQKPDILIQEHLQSGRPTQLTCSLPGACGGGRPLTFSWAGAAVDSLNHQNLHSSVLTFTPRPQDHGTNLTCQVKLQRSRVTTQRTIWLNVFYAPWNLTIGVFFRNVTALKIVQDTSIPILEGETLQLLCVADSNPPAQLSWFRGPPALNTTLISSTSILELPRVGTGEGKFTCQAWHPLGSQSISLSLSVVYPPRLLGPSCSWEDGDLHCSCSSQAQPAPSLRWWLGAGLLENPSNTSYTVTSSSEGPWANSSLSLPAGLSAGLRLSCEAENVHGAQRASVLLLPGKLVSVSRVVPAAFGGAGVMALLFLCLCLIFFCIVKNHRRRAAGRRKVANDEDPVMDTAAWGSQQNPRMNGPSDQQSPPGDISAWREEQDTQYINLRFHGRKLWEPQDKGATSTCVYSEIKKTSQ